MMKTFVGPVFDEDHVAYLRAETCQPIFVDFNLVRVATRQKLPFGIAQIGKAFRNEINPRNFTFRSREFTQMEMEFFCFDEDSMQWYEYWKNERLKYYREKLKFRDDEIKIHEHETLAHYAKAALDVDSNSLSAGASLKESITEAPGTCRGIRNFPERIRNILIRTTIEK
jgi:glycyl-tRNA synthetase